MKSYVWCIILLIVAYLIGVKFPSAGTKLFNLTGM